MNKSIIAVAAAILTVNTASAANWMLITDSPNGARILGDTTSFQQDDKMLAATFATVTSGDGLTPFTVMITKASCKVAQGPLVTIENATAATLWWSANGNKIYDYIGRLLCAIWEGRK